MAAESHRRLTESDRRDQIALRALTEMRHSRTKVLILLGILKFKLFWFYEMLMLDEVFHLKFKLHAD